MSKFARSSKNCEKLEKSQFLLKLLNSSGKGGTRVSSKNCDFCNFCDFSKNYEKLEKSQFLLKLIKSRACKPGHKSKLMEINSDKLKELNKKFKRKRMVNIGKCALQKMYFKISFQTLKKYDDWWRNYKLL